MHFIFICHLLMLTYFCVVNVPEFQYCFWLFTDVDYFSCAKCSHNFWLMFMWFPCTETYWWSVHTSSSADVDIFVCGKYSNISVVFLIFNWCWLFFMCKMFLSFSTDVYVIFLYWNILMKCMHFIFICHWLMLTYFCVENVPEFQYCFWLFTDIDYFSCAKCSYDFRLMFMSFSCTETYWWSVYTSSSFVIDWCWHFLCGKFSRISIVFLIIYWCWLFFMCQSFFKKVSLSSGHKVSLRKFL